jgi:serine protease Do
LPDFRPLVRKYGDAVVFVEVVQRRQLTSGGLAPDDPLFEFFRRFGLPAPDLGPRGNMPPARGAGSGFIVSEDGYILTNAHVVAEADEVTVRMTDRREYPAKVIGADAVTDVAVIKIEAENLPTVRIGNAETLEPGQWVAAIGSPFGLENSVTVGVVSATSRALGMGAAVPFIQTDVAVNPGNSGGPLFNLQGEVVGVNSMIFSQTGGYMGLSFAIPIDVAIDVRDQLIETGRVVRGRIGVVVQDMNAQFAESFGLDRPRGALVSSVEKGGPADKAGIRVGDVILSLNDKPIDRFSDLSSSVAAMKPGSEAKLTVWRDGKEIKLNVLVEEMEQPPVRAGQAEPRGQTPEGRIGLAVRPLSREERESAGTEGDLVVVQAAGSAAEAGIQPGDIVLGVNGRRVKSVNELRQAVEKSSGAVALLIQRDNAQIFVPVQKR